MSLSKTILALILPVFALATLSCKKSDRTIQQNVNMTVTSEAADGLDLKAVTALLKDIKTPEELEKRINSGSPRICNLDLNEDNKIDYVQVEEYSKDSVRGFSLFTELDKGDRQELATIEITKDADGKSQIQTHGNSHVYGHNYYHYYRGPTLLDYYLWTSHRPYYSSWGYNRYPSHFSSPPPLPRNSYQSGLKSMDTASVSQSKVPKFASSNASPNKGKFSNKVKAPLRAPTTSQRSFQKRNPSRSVRSGGFGSRSGSSSSRPSYRSSGSVRSSSRSGSSFGGGK